MTGPLLVDAVAPPEKTHVLLRDPRYVLHSTVPTHKARSPAVSGMTGR